MRTLAGPNAHLHFTHLSKSSCGSLSSAFTDASSGESPLAQASCHQEGVLDLMQKSGVSLAQVCLLDPKAERILSPEDGDGRFAWFLFGVCRLQVLIFSSNHLDVQGNIRCGPCTGLVLFNQAQIPMQKGDDPPRDRTSELRVHGFPTRHLGPVQMTTDTAVGMTKLVVQDKLPIHQITYVVSHQRVTLFPVMQLSELRITQQSSLMQKNR